MKKNFIGFNPDVCSKLYRIVNGINSTDNVSLSVMIEGKEYTLCHKSLESSYFTMEDGREIRISNHWSNSDVAELNINDSVGDNFYDLYNATECAFDIVINDVKIIACGGIPSYDDFLKNQNEDEDEDDDGIEAINTNPVPYWYIKKHNRAIKQLKNDLQLEKYRYAHDVRDLNYKIEDANKNVEFFKKCRDDLKNNIENAKRDIENRDENVKKSEKIGTIRKRVKS